MSLFKLEFVGSSNFLFGTIQQPRFEHDVAGFNGVNSKQFTYLFSVDEAEHVLRGSAIQAWSRVGCNVRIHERDVLVVEAVERSTFGQNPPNDRMFLLNGTFLLRFVGVAIEEFCPRFSLRSLDRQGIAKLTSSICEDDRKEFLESFLSELFVKSFEDLVDRPGCAAIQQEEEQEVG